MLPLAPLASHSPCLSPVSDPLELGQVPICVIPNMMTYTDVKRHAHFLEQFFPTDNVYPRQRRGGFKTRNGTYLYKMPGGVETSCITSSVSMMCNCIMMEGAL